ncbi:MAG: YgiT-type zinc finger protein [Deltaproteobacteria bacterium]|nr:YgiT-type zinc finger protein [Deltaproteobacteria bacterium]
MDHQEQMRCCFCGGEVVARHITHFRQTPQGTAEFRGVPCEECLVCGEKYFSPEAVRRMEELSSMPAHEYVQLPAYDYA